MITNFTMETQNPKIKHLHHLIYKTVIVNGWTH